MPEPERRSVTQKEPGVDPLAPEGLVGLEGGPFLMGTDDVSIPGDGEGPVREVTLDPFSIGRFAVTNEEFAAFVEATGHETEAERFGWSFVYAGFLPEDFPDTAAVAASPWWRQVDDADWRRPEGPQSSSEDRRDHPVVHISWNDAQVYCSWAGVRLPTEAEWEYAARGGLVQKRYVWGDEFKPDGQTMCNIFEGTFPAHNTAEDGYAGTAPVEAFPANGYGLHNMPGNVWEWCQDRFSPTFHIDGPRVNPTGPSIGAERVTRGGSYLCHDSYCSRYRVAARNRNTADTSAGNLGFRVAKIH